MWVVLFSSFCFSVFSEINNFFFVCMFLKPEAKWLRYGEICSCRIVNTATVQAGWVMGINGLCWDRATQGHWTPMQPSQPGT